ncbi:MAG TPA: FUSC family protein [Microbacteriaceae bacterium]|nr:FUSC family protein [Microbacteriaceae bacterium]
MRPVLRTDWLRLRDSLPAIAQMVIASVSAYLLASTLLPESTPLIAAIIPLSSLGFLGDARPIRVLETASAMTIGIILAEVLAATAGQSVWTFTLALVLTLLLARFMSAKAAFAIAAAVQCSLVMLSPLPPAGQWVRILDALIGGAIAVLATALVPRAPWRTVTRLGRRLLDAHVAVHSQLARALREADPEQSANALAHARALTELVSDWRDASQSGRAIATVSPWFWRKRDEFDRIVGMVDAIDLTTRGLRVIARRVDYLVGLGEPHPELAELLERIGRATDLLGASITDLTERPTARHELSEIAKWLSPETVFAGEASAAENNVLQAARPLLTDSLVATGLSVEDARARLAVID